MTKSILLHGIKIWSSATNPPYYPLLLAMLLSYHSHIPCSLIQITSLMTSVVQLQSCVKSQEHAAGQHNVVLYIIEESRGKLNLPHDFEKVSAQVHIISELMLLVTTRHASILAITADLQRSTDIRLFYHHSLTKFKS